jgi:hypothetical protein
MVNRAEILAQLLQECEDDHVGLWSILWQVRYALNENDYPCDDRADPREVRKITMELVHALLESGQVQAGFPAPDGKGFVPWSLSSEETITRIKSEWDVLGREPNIGEIIWFSTPTVEKTPEARVHS